MKDTTTSLSFCVFFFTVFSLSSTFLQSCFGARVLVVERRPSYGHAVCRQRRRPKKQSSSLLHRVRADACRCKSFLFASRTGKVVRHPFYGALLCTPLLDLSRGKVPVQSFRAHQGAKHVRGVFRLPRDTLSIPARLQPQTCQSIVMKDCCSLRRTYESCCLSFCFPRAERLKCRQSIVDGPAGQCTTRPS